MSNNRILEERSQFNYLGSDICYDMNYDIHVNLGKSQTICGTINQIFTNKICQDTKLEVLQSYGSPRTVLWAVSYTHLDVYKRQVFIFPPYI